MDPAAAHSPTSCSMGDPALHQSQFHPTCCVTLDTSSPPRQNTYERRRPVDYDVFEISPTVRACTRHAYADWPLRRGRNPLGRGSPAVACSATPPSAIGGRHSRCNFRLASQTHGWVATSLTLPIHRQTAPSLRCPSSQLALPTTNPTCFRCARHLS